tara:strand:+ start:412 stop:591 length:180 start_codon:yes stop_codon:yes gene_type:complete
MERPDPMIPSKTGASDVEAMRNRQKWIDSLYLFDKRDDPDHPMHGLYTGLHQKYQQSVH